MPASEASGQQKSSFASLTNSGPGYGINSATGKPSCSTSNAHSEYHAPSEYHAHSEYLTLAWQNMASITNARNVSREANQKAKQYYTFTFIDDLEEDVAGTGDTIGEDNELDEDESAYNSKFSFEDEEAWLGTRKKANIEDILNNNEKALEDNLQTKPAKPNVIGMIVSQSANCSSKV
eukprot:GFUD01012656.1.p1 GENE.GFUD01012656.1~~GFUD01012656.1.p1  ORF type:complete len:178 (-),score=57.22 GFUD01012656.1:101-634(-)